VIVLVLFLFAAACLGHLVWMVGVHNWWYGQALPRHSGTIVHLVHGVFILAGWALFWWLCGFDLLALFRWPPAMWWQPWLAGYVALC